MAEIINFDTDGAFFKRNMPFIERYYFRHFYLIKAYETLLSGQHKVVDAFNVADGELLIIYLATDAGIFIYGNAFNEAMIDMLYTRATRNKYTNFSFSGNKAILTSLFDSFHIDYTIIKDRIIYETKATLPLKRKHLGKALKSGTIDLEILAQMSYQYSIEEWGEREGRRMDYVRLMVKQAVQDGALVQYDISLGIACIAQVLNMQNGLPIIGSLYTPAEKRGKGYATMLVHALTKKILGNGFEKCGIISDATNPITSKLFVNVGYLPVYEHLSLHTKAFKKQD
jgi:GNAT superfamily N-acetyltransferase